MYLVINFNPQKKKEKNPKKRLQCPRTLLFLGMLIIYLL